MAFLEHANITVTDAKATADMLVHLFDWKIRWQGPAFQDGRSIHVGTDTGYLAVFSHPSANGGMVDPHRIIGALNHIGVVVDDLEVAENRVLEYGYETHSHGDYEPGKRFYFNDSDGIEFEVVSYD